MQARNSARIASVVGEETTTGRTNRRCRREKSNRAKARRETKAVAH